MTINGWLQIVLYFVIIIALTVLLGGYMTRVLNGERTFLSPVLRPVEAAIYWAGGVDEKARAGLAHLYGRHAAVPRRRLSRRLRSDAPAGDAAAQSGRSNRRSAPIYRSTRRSASSPTPTGRTTAAKARCPISRRCSASRTQNFLSAATGIVLAIALIRGFARASAKTVGNFWVDLTRCTLYILLPICDRHARCSWSGRACRRLSAPMSTRPRWKAPSRPSRKARSPRRSRSRARHQWRRLLQRQFRASVRESDRASEFRRR